MKEKNKKVLFVANVAKEHVVKFHLPTIRKFREEGWQVDVACFHDADISDCDCQYDASWNRSPFSINTFIGISEIKQILKETHYDLVYCHTPVGGLVSRLGAKEARKTGTKVIYTVHGFHFFRNAPKKNWLIYYPVEKFLSHYCDAIFTVNEEDYQLAKERFTGTKIRLIPEVGVDFKRLDIKEPQAVRMAYRQKMNIPENAFVMIYVAELIPNKNQEMLLNVLKKLREKGQDVYLILAGPDHYEGHLQKLASEMNIEDYVRFPGWSNDVGELMHTADVCTASSIREGFGINLIEALYCGLPAIATDNRGHRMALRNGENGLLVDANDYNKMAEYVERIAQDEAFRERYSHIDVHEYEADLIADQIYHILIEEISNDAQ